MIISPVGFWLRRWLLPCVALAFLLLAAGSAQATITVLNYWHLGENDPGAVSGGQCTITTDTGGHTLTNTPVAGPHPIYTNGVSLAVSAETASVLAVAFTNNEYLAGNVATAAVDNFGIECWVNTGTNAGAHMVVNNGLRNNGWGLYQSGTTYEAIYGGRTFFGSAAAPMNTWVHLALVRNNGVAILYTNGVPASTNSVTAPIMPSDSFTVGGDANFPEYFVGGIDEVRVFTFASGAFSTNDLLLNATHLLVVNTNDAGPGSLRNAIAYAPSGATVNFTNTLSGQTILLTSGALAVNQSVTIDASALADGIQLNGNASSPVLLIQSGTVHLSSLTITNGNDISGSYAGGIASITTLTMDNCTIAGNLDSLGGGGIYNEGTLTMNHCTVAHNNSGKGVGGGLLNDDTATLNNCTLTDNRADYISQLGGGIFNDGALVLNNCTLADNYATEGGGIRNFSGSLNLTNSIVCGNTAPSDPDVGGPYSGAGNLVGLDAQLAPLGNYGGSTPTMPPYAGSPAIDAGSDTVNSFLTTDQRGHARQSGAHVDIGAVEVDTNSIVTLSTDTGAAGTLRYAAAHTQTNDLISFTNTLSGATILLSGSAITLNQGVTIDGSTLMNGIQINGNASSPVLVVHAGTVLLNSLTITNGNDVSGNEAGGIANYTTLTLDNCTIAGSVESGGGGGIFNFSGSLTLNNCTVANNDSGAGSGGGIFNNGTLTLNDSTLAGNRADGSGLTGGGICNFYTGILKLNNSTLAGNSSDAGGGIYNFGTLKLTNSIVCGNTAASDPDVGGLYSGAGNLVGLDAQLAPLGNYGGRMQTMPPYAGSPAIDAGSDAVTNFITTDQRGHPRPSGAHVDIGAVEVDTNSIVTLNTDDGAAGTLRYAVANIQTRDLISFAPNLSGATILLTSSIVLSQDVTIDASALANAVQLNGNATSPVLLVNAGTVGLSSLTITNGNDANGNDAGGIYNQATLTLANCTVAGNAGTFGGGGIFNDFGTLTLNHCTVANNSGGAYGDGGGIFNNGALTLNDSTLAGNRTDDPELTGGGICNFYSGMLTLNNSTLVGNSSGSGGGIYNYGTLNLTNTIVCGNTASSGPNIFHQNDTYNVGTSLVDANAQLAPLGNYGGPTQTMPPYAGSPAIDAGSDAVTSFLTTDQRGHPRRSGAHVDIGAVEVNTNSVVTLNSDSSAAGTLRYAVANAQPGDLISFAQNLSGATILLGGSAIALNQGATIDASPLANGIQLNGNASSGVLIAFDGTVFLNSLTITNGNDISGSYAGGIANYTTLTLDNCTIAGNLEPASGGGIYNAGTLTLNNCTLADNDGGSGSGGGIENSSTLTLNNSTVAHNRTRSAGGGIYSLGTLNLTNSIICGNTAASSPDIGGTYSAANTLVGVNALLAPLGNYGGPTPTMPPYAGSPAIDAGSDAVTSFLTTDQRGHARTSGAHVDIGAVEVDPNSIVTLSTDTGAAGTLRYAVANTQANDLINFATTLSGATILLSGSAITLNQGVTIDGSSLTNAVQINGNASSPVLVVHAGTVLLNSLTITNGYDASGVQAGGIANYSRLTLDNCTIAGSVDLNGAGGFYNSTTLTLNNCTVANNTGSGGHGGGIFNDGLLTVNNSTLADNSSSNGGGIYNGTGTVYLTNAIVCSNTAASSPDMSGTYSAANTLVGVNALLAPLGNYGGLTQTMPPEPGSPALGAGNPAVTNFLATDQRGLPRAIGGNVDIGAVELQSGEAHSIVLNTNDAGPGSLRQTIANAATTATVTFAPSLSGQVILLSSGQIALGNSGLVIDGSALSGGVQINGTASSRHFTVNSGASVVLNALTLTNGLATTGNAGGAVNNNGTLTVNNCTVVGNSSTVSGVGGGAIHNGGTLNVNNSTLAQNHSAFFGGAIANANSMTVKVNNSTIVSNTATAGGGIYNNGGFLDVTNSIVAGNTPLGGDIVNSATFNQASNLYNTASAQVSPLGNYGGPTQTMPPKPGSPAIDGGTATIATTDQRGYPRLSGAHVDIGAVEVQFASAPFRLGSLSRLGNGTVQLSFTNLMGGNFTAFATTNLTQPFNTWSNLGPVTESPVGSGVFQFTDPQASKYPQRFYSVTSP